MKRVYKSESREAQGKKTRGKILESALQLFQKEGFEKTTIQQIAERAKVAMPTVYALFKSKQGLLQALIDAALPAVKFTALVDDSMRESSPVKRLAVTAKLARQMYDAERELMGLLRFSPELKDLEQEREMRRYERQKEYVKQFEKERSLLEGLTLEKARDILWALTGRDLYRMLVIEQGWSGDAYEKWLAHLLVEALISPQAPR